MNRCNGLPVSMQIASHLLFYHGDFECPDYYCIIIDFKDPSAIRC